MKQLSVDRAEAAHTGGSETRGVPELVTIVMPCRNERRHIRECLESVLGNGYPLDRLEILVVDGESEDGTRAIITEYAQRYACVRLLSNSRRIIPAALNLGIRAARGDVVMRMDAHATYAPGYIERCVAALNQSGADNVGGVWVVAPPRSEGMMAEAIAVTLSHRFGIGAARYRLGVDRPTDVDTAPFGCYRRELFDRIGLYDENLSRGEDMEFNLRLRAAGGRVLLVPNVVCYYHPRSTLSDFARHNFSNGIWVCYPLRYGRVAFSLRHLIPGLFVGILTGSLLANLYWSRAWVLTAVVVGTYAGAAAMASLLVAWRSRRWYLAPLLPVTFAALHLTYGTGTLVGLLGAAARGSFWRWVFGRTVRVPG